MPSEQPKIDDGGPAFPCEEDYTYSAGAGVEKHIGMSLLAFLASQESLTDICTEIWDMNRKYVESITGCAMPEHVGVVGAAEYEALFFAKLRVIRAKALLKELQSCSSV